MTKYFVWVNGLRGPVPQIWYDDLPTDGNGKVKVTLACEKLDDSDNRSIDNLAKVYPYVEQA